MSEGQEPTADELKAQVEAKTKELKADKNVPLDLPVVNHPAPVVTPPEPVPSPDPVPSVPSSESHPAPQGDEDTQTWMRKKGFKTPDDMAKSLRELERKFHESRQKPEPQAPAPVQQQWQPTPQAAPPPYAYPPYQPNPALQREQAIRAIAERHQMDPEDAAKLIPFTLDIADMAARRTAERFEGKVARLERENARNSEFIRLQGEPAFNAPEVQKEMHAISEAHPEIWNEPQAYTALFREAMYRLANKQYQQGPAPQTQAPNGHTRPPTTAGNNSGALPANLSDPFAGMTEERFNKLPAPEQRKYLEAIGAVAPVR